MLLPEAMECAQRPALQVRKNDVNPLENDVGGHRPIARIDLPEATAGHLVVRGKGVRPQCRSGKGVRYHARNDALSRTVRDAREPDASDAMVADRLDRSSDPYLAGCAAAATPLQCVRLAPLRDGGLVHVDSSGKRVRLGFTIARLSLWSTSQAVL